MPVKIDKPAVELTANPVDFEEIVRDIMLVVGDIVDVKTTDMDWNVVNEDVRRVIVTAWSGRVVYDPRTTEFAVKQAMRRATNKYGGNCRTCKSYKGAKANSKKCTPESDTVLGCSKYENRSAYYDKKRRRVFENI